MASIMFPDRPANPTAGYRVAVHLKIPISATPSEGQRGALVGNDADGIDHLAGPAGNADEVLIRIET